MLKVDIWGVCGRRRPHAPQRTGVCVSRCLWSWMSWWSTGTRSCSGGKRLDGWSLRRRWRRIWSVGWGLKSPPSPSAPYWNSEKRSPMVRRLFAAPCRKSKCCTSFKFHFKICLLIDWFTLLIPNLENPFIARSPLPEHHSHSLWLHTNVLRSFTLKSPQITWKSEQNKWRKNESLINRFNNWHLITTI